MIALVRARRALRVTALATAILFTNLVVATQMGTLFGAISPAWAQAGGAGRKIAVFILPESAGDAEIAFVLNSIIRENTRLLAEVDLVEAEESEGEEGLAEAERLIDAGVEALNRRDYAVAEQSLARGYALIERGLSAVPRRLHALALKGLGVARFFLGKGAEARALIKKSLLMFEKQTADEYAYSLEAKNLYREIRQELQDLPTGALEIRSRPPGAAVYVDYYLKGFTLEGKPLVLQNLPAGPHFVRVGLDGHFVWTGYVEVEPAGTASVDAPLRMGAKGPRLQALLEDAHSALRSGRGAEFPLRGLRDHLGATEVLVALASPSPEGFQVSGFHLPPDDTLVPVDETVVQDTTLSQNLRDFTALTLGGDFEAQETLSLGTPAGGADEISLAPAGGEDLFLDPSAPIFEGTRAPQDTPVYKKWWFWTILGVAVGGLTAGIVLVSTTRSGGGGGPTGGVTVNLNSF